MCTTTKKIQTYLLLGSRRQDEGEREIAYWFQCAENPTKDTALQLRCDSSRKKEVVILIPT